MERAVRIMMIAFFSPFVLIAMIAGGAQAGEVGIAIAVCVAAQLLLLVIMIATSDRRPRVNPLPPQHDRKRGQFVPTPEQSSGGRTVDAWFKAVVDSRKRYNGAEIRPRRVRASK